MIRMSPSNSLEIYLKKLSCVTLIILLHKIIMHLHNKECYPDHYYSKKYWAKGLLLLENGGDKCNSLLFRTFYKDLLRGSDD